MVKSPNLGILSPFCPGFPGQQIQHDVVSFAFRECTARAFRVSSVRCSQERTTDIWTDHAWTTESVKQKHRSAVGKDVSWNFGVVFRFWTLGLNLVDVDGGYL